MLHNSFSWPRVAAAALLLAGGCLAAPPSNVEASDAMVADAAREVDVAAVGCDTGDLDIRFDDVSDIDGWASSDDGCTIGVDLGVLAVENAGQLATCELVSNLSINLVGRTIRSRIADTAGTLSMSFGLVLTDGEDDPLLRRRISFELDDDLITVRDCIGLGGQCPTQYTEFPYSPTEHVWWGFEHAVGTETVYFIVAADDMVFAPVASATAITSDLVACVEAKFASFEETPDTGRVEFDDVEVR